MTRSSLTATVMLCGLLAACGASEEQAPSASTDHAAVPTPKPMTSGLPPMEAALILPGKSGQVDYAAHCTCRACLLSKVLGLTYPRDECRRWGL